MFISKKSIYNFVQTLNKTARTVWFDQTADYCHIAFKTHTIIL
jgi:hypothetical protein